MTLPSPGTLHDRARQDSPASVPRLTKDVCRELAAPFSHPWDRRYCYWKLRTDPLYPAVARALLEADDGTTPLLDIGCGLGLFASYLKAAGFLSPVLGMDSDGRKIRMASQAAQRWGAQKVEFRQADVRETLPAFRGHVTILDVLQYLDAEEERTLLQTAADSVPADGLLVIRTGLADAGWRFRLTQLVDRLAQGCFWIKAPPVRYPRKTELEATLLEAGLQGDFRPLWGRTPFNNYLGVFRRVP